MSTAPGADAATIARVLNLNVSSIHRLAKEAGFPAKLAPGEFDLNKVTLWYIRYIQAELRRRGPGSGPATAGLASERLRVLKGQAEKIELGNAVQRGEYLKASAVEMIWTRGLAICRARMLAMPSKLAPLLANKQAGFIAEEMKIEIYRALTELASGEVPGDAESSPDVL